MWLCCALGGMLALACVAPHVQADEHVATVTELDGRAFAYLPGTPARTLQEGDGVDEKTRIVTGKNASLTLVFSDETRLVLGASTVINIDNYRYRPQAQAPAGDDGDDDDPAFSFSTSIITGAVRSISGLIGKYRPRKVVYRTTVATIGIRGTHFAADVQETSATVILLAQEDETASNAIEVANAYGKVEIAQPGYGTEIPDAHSPPSPPRLMQTTSSMTRILRSVNTTRRVRVPRSPMR